jgi:Fur family ferric uptake transcriptional regulator
VSQDPEGLLRAAGLKVTEQRRKILTFLLEHHGPFTVEEMAHRLKAEAFDLATIYRNMIAFEEARLVEKLHFGDGSQRWEIAHQKDDHHHHRHHHHHLICRACKKIITLDICLSSAELKKVASLGYGDVRHNLEFSGICPDCLLHNR